MKLKTVKQEKFYFSFSYSKFNFNLYTISLTRRKSCFNNKISINSQTVLINNKIYFSTKSLFSKSVKKDSKKIIKTENLKINMESKDLKNGLVVINETNKDYLNKQKNKELENYDSEVEKSNLNYLNLDFIKTDINEIPIKGETYYESFGVKETANLKEIKLKYILIAKKYHPDKDIKYLVSLLFYSFKLN